MSYSTAGALAVAVFLAGLGQPGAAADDAPSPVRATGGAYCGVYSLYAAAAAVNRPIPFERLLQEKYIGSNSGSSLQELEQAALDHGLHCQAMQAMSPSALRGASCPVLLHVRTPGRGTRHDHWVLFLGVDEAGENALIVDPPADVTPVPLSEVCALWDGVGLMVGDSPDRFAAPRLGSWLNQSLAVAFVGALVALGTALARRAPWYGRVGVLAAVGLLAPAVWHAVHPDGFVGRRVAIAQVAGRYFRPDLPVIDAAGVEAALGDPGVTILDARTPDAFRYGHIAGAVNVPVFTGVSQRDRLVRDIPPTNRVIVYCQSEACPWAESVGGDLSLRGYRVFVFPQGYNGWREYRRGR